MDTEVRLTVRKIFKRLREKESETNIASRKSDRVDVDTMLREYRELDPHLREPD